jgi:hypothetical protein
LAELSATLGAYTHCVAISNHRLVALADGNVTFRWRDSAHGNQKPVHDRSSSLGLRRIGLSPRWKNSSGKVYFADLSENGCET